MDAGMAPVPTACQGNGVTGLYVHAMQKNPPRDRIHSNSVDFPDGGP
jgi:hypothetical protein